MAENVSEKNILCPTKKRKRNHRENDISEVVEEVSYEDYICPICLQLLIEPVVMPCKHELCKICFTQNVEEANLQCPICRVRISSWARKQARNGSLICQKRWDLIQKLFPEKCERRMRGEDDEGEDFYICHKPLKRILSENGEIRSEYEEELRKIRLAREEECRASEDFICRLMEEEKNINNEMEQLREKDEEIARKIHQQINETQVATPFKAVTNKLASPGTKARNKSKKSNGSPSLERWFSPTSRLKTTSVIEHNSVQNQDSKRCEAFQEHPKARSNIYKDCGSTILSKDLDQKYKQEQEDFALALKLQHEFDKERRGERVVERKKGTVDGYMLRNDHCTTTSTTSS